jgi:hypothetical protein
VDGTGSGSCPVAPGLGVRGVESPGSAAGDLVWLECESARKSGTSILLPPILISNLFSACLAYNQADSF